MNTHTISVRVTSFQAEEVAGLLDVARDEQAASGERSPWGEIAGSTLTVWDVRDAIDDLETRADTLDDNYSFEGVRVRGHARSLRTLADNIATAGGIS